MNAVEVTALLTVCASFDQRKPNPETVPAWVAALGDLEFTACRDAVVAHYQESREWIMPADIRGRVRRARAAAIRIDEALELRPHDPDDTALHIRLLAEARRNAIENQDYEPTDLVGRNIAALGGPVRRVNELEDNDRRTYVERAKEANRVALAELAAAPEVEPEPAPVVMFGCEHMDDTTPCGRPAPHLSADRRRPLCEAHVELEESKA